LEYIFPILVFLPRKIWQPCDTLNFSKEKKSVLKVGQTFLPASVFKASPRSDPPDRQLPHEVGSVWMNAAASLGAML
jgi:hypothetical protein